MLPGHCDFVSCKTNQNTFYTDRDGFTRLKKTKSGFFSQQLLLLCWCENHKAIVSLLPASHRAESFHFKSHLPTSCSMNLLSEDGLWFDPKVNRPKSSCSCKMNKKRIISRQVYLIISKLTAHLRHTLGKMWSHLGVLRQHVFRPK